MCFGFSNDSPVSIGKEQLKTDWPIADSRSLEGMRRSRRYPEFLGNNQL